MSSALPHGPRLGETAAHAADAMIEVSGMVPAVIRVVRSTAAASVNSARRLNRSMDSVIVDVADRINGSNSRTAAVMMERINNASSSPSASEHRPSLVLEDPPPRAASSRVKEASNAKGGGAAVAGAVVATSNGSKPLERLRNNSRNSRKHRPRPCRQRPVLKRLQRLR